MSSRPFIFAAQSVLMLAAAAALCAAPARAQYVGQIANPDKNAPEFRAVAVIEWIGDEQHPTRSRIIPITVFDGHELQDAAIYLAQPQPLALDGGVEYQLKEDGKNTGLFVVYGASQESGSWVGYGKWQPLPKPKASAPVNPQNWKIDDAESDTPVLHRKHHADDSGPGSGPSSSGGDSGSPGASPDPDRPTLHRPASSGDSGTDTASNSGSGPAPDTDRPTLHKSPDSGASSTASPGGGDDPDRPKLKKKKTGDTGDEEPSVSSVDSTDPNRPKLKRGQVSYGGNEGGVAPPALKGLPLEMHQTVAVSDARNTPEHPWAFSWANPDDQQKYKAQLEDLARAALGLNPPPAPAPASKPAAKAPTRKSAKAAAPPPPPEPAPLEDEEFRVFELAYDSGATMVLSAHTAETGAGEKFVTLIAQPNLYGNVVVLLKSITDGAHLDDAPRLRLIDAVDAMADNRGELLFELRGQTQRQFALYRVLRGQVTRLFVSGGGDFGTASSNY